MANGHVVSNPRLKNDRSRPYGRSLAIVRLGLMNCPLLDSSLIGQFPPRPNIDRTCTTNKRSNLRRNVMVNKLRSYDRVLTMCFLDWIVSCHDVSCQRLGLGEYLGIEGDVVSCLYESGCTTLPTAISDLSTNERLFVLNWPRNDGL